MVSDRVFAVPVGANLEQLRDGDRQSRERFTVAFKPFEGRFEVVGEAVEVGQSGHDRNAVHLALAGGHDW